MGDNQMHSVYRLFDKDNTLLYVGSSTSALRRILEHKADKSWFVCVATVTITNFESNHLAWLAEIEAIKTENPRHNMKYNQNYIHPKSSGRPRGSRYEITGDHRVFPFDRKECTKKQVTRICQGVRNWANVAGVKVRCCAVPGAVEAYIVKPIT